MIFELVNGEVKVFDVKLRGVGRMEMKDGPVPAVKADDFRRDPAIDFASADKTLMAWIRRAVHAETFAKALEKELEALREAVP